jgi:hypothetical protein
MSIALRESQCLRGFGADLLGDNLNLESPILGRFPRAISFGVRPEHRQHEVAHLMKFVPWTRITRIAN